VDEELFSIDSRIGLDYDVLDYAEAEIEKVYKIMQFLEKPWRRNTSHFLTVNSIFAALSGVLIVLVLQEDKYFNKLIPLIHIPFAFLAVGIFFISFFLFALAAEKTTDALDEDDSKKYVYYMLHYNAGVVLLLGGIALLIFFRYYPLASSLIPASVMVPVLKLLIPKWVIHLIIFAIYLAVIVGFFLYRFWINDIKFILSTKEVLKDYFDELEGLKQPEINWSSWASKFYKWRLGWEAPRTAIMELRASKIDGFGVFTVNEIKKGSVIAEGIHEEDYHNLIPWSKFKSYNQDLKNKILSFCIGTPEGFIPLDLKKPLDFDRIPAESCMNHSCDGNVGFNEVGDFVAIRDIKPGDELTYDYGLGESNPEFKMECKCGSQDCRKLITGNDWKGENFRNKNLNVMLPALRKAPF
jgi:hypothetical protein